MNSKKWYTQQVRNRVDQFIIEAGGAGLGPGRRQWRFDGVMHRIVLSSYGDVKGQLVAEYDKIGHDLVRRMLVASIWPAPLGVIYVWSEWRRDREAELSRYGDAQRAANIVTDLYEAARRADGEELARQVARYHATLDEAGRDAAANAVIWAHMDD